MSLATRKIISPVNVEDRKKLDIRSGDTVRVWQKIEEKDRVRLQAFEGIVLAVKHGKEPGATFTVRRVVGGTGVERIFPLYSPAIDKIEILKRAKVRRAKLYYIRDKAARQIRRQMRRMVNMGVSTESDLETQARAKEEAAAEAEKEEAQEKQEESATPKSPNEEGESLEEKIEDASTEEVKEQIKQDDPEENPIKEAEKEIKEKQEERKEETK